MHIRPPPAAPRWPHSVVLEKEGPNDGLVSLQSAQWVRVSASHSPLPRPSALARSLPPANDDALTPASDRARTSGRSRA